MSLDNQYEKMRSPIIIDDLGWGEGFRIVGFDFETLTPKGRSPEPFEIGVVIMDGSGRIVEDGRIQRFIMPPHDVPITAADIKQTGIHPQDLEGARPAELVLAEINDNLAPFEVILIAQNAPYDRAILERFVGSSQYLLSRPCVDTIKLAKWLHPRFERYGLSYLAREFGIPIPEDRHRAVPDVELTLKVLQEMVSTLETRGQNKLSEIITFGDITGRPDPRQMSLF